MARLRILCAQSVVLAEKVFSHLGNVTIISDEDINRDSLQDQECLIVRSKTAVTKKLIEGSKIQFIGTATAGLDHIDEKYINQCADGKGANAASVAEYVISGLLYLEYHKKISLQGKTLGIIGYGNVGRCLEKYAKALGMNVIANDPPLEDKLKRQHLFPLKKIFEETDILSLHIPLVKNGKYKTTAYADYEFFKQFKKPIVFINSARGDIVNEDHLLYAMDKGWVRESIIDVWRNEPQINSELVHRATLATPHIAGYSWPGRICGTLQVYRQCCEYYFVEPRWKLEDLYSLPSKVSSSNNLYEALKSIYDIEKDSRTLKTFSRDRIVVGFNQMRQSYPKRDEFSLGAVNSKMNQDVVYD